MQMRFTFVMFILVLLPGIAVAQDAQPSNQTKQDKKTAKSQQASNFANLKAALIAARADAEDAVLRAKQIKDKTKQQEAQTRYAKAANRYNAYITVMLDAMQQGQTVDLDPTAKEAESAANAFEEYVDANAPSRSLTAVLTVAKTLVDAGIAIHAKFQSASKEQREQAAKELEQKLKWKKWDEITS